MLGPIVMIVEYELIPYVDICNLYRTLPDPRDLATYIYRGQEGTVEGRLKESQVEHPSLLLIHTYFD
jgi:hypothetical protein